MNIDKHTAEQLWDELRGSLLGTQEALSKIVEHKAWEPLGYESFATAWQDRMAGIQLAGVMEAAAVYALFDSGSSVTDVALSVNGVGPKRAKAYAQAHTAGVAVTHAESHAARMMRTGLKPGETFIPAHVRKKATRKNRIILEGFTDEEIVSWKREAEEVGMSWRDFCAAALRAGMSEGAGLA